MAHLGHSPCHFKENHWFDPKGRCPGAFWIILWAAVGGGDVRLPEGLMQRDSSWWPCASGPRVGIGSCPLCLVTRVLGHIHRGEALGAFHGAGTSSHPVTLAWDGPWQGRLRWPAGSARGLAGGPRCKSSGTAGEEWRRAQHRRERGPGPWSTVRTEPPTSVNRQTAPARLLAPAVPAARCGDHCRVPASGWRWRLSWALRGRHA